MDLIEIAENTVKNYFNFGIAFINCKYDYWIVNLSFSSSYTSK